mgnify:CR=1 FL=1
MSLNNFITEFNIISGDFVTDSDGTGIVHVAPTFGADDDRVAKAMGIVPLVLIDKQGERRPMVDFRGCFFKIQDLDPAFVKDYIDLVKYSMDFLKDSINFLRDFIGFLRDSIDFPRIALTT